MSSRVNFIAGAAVALSAGSSVGAIRPFSTSGAKPSGSVEEVPGQLKKVAFELKKNANDRYLAFRAALLESVKKQSRTKPEMTDAQAKKIVADTYWEFGSHAGWRRYFVLAVHEPEQLGLGFHPKNQVAGSEKAYESVLGEGRETAYTIVMRALQDESLKESFIQGSLNTEAELEELCAKRNDDELQCIMASHAKSFNVAVTEQKIEWYSNGEENGTCTSEGGDDTITSTNWPGTSGAGSLEKCQRDCSKNKLCSAVEYYAESGQCDLILARNSYDTENVAWYKRESETLRPGAKCYIGKQVNPADENIPKDCAIECDAAGYECKSDKTEWQHMLDFTRSDFEFVSCTQACTIRARLANQTQTETSDPKQQCLDFVRAQAAERSTSDPLCQRKIGEVTYKFCDDKWEQRGCRALGKADGEAGCNIVLNYNKGIDATWNSGDKPNFCIGRGDKVAASRAFGGNGNLDKCKNLCLMNKSCSGVEWQGDAQLCYHVLGGGQVAYTGRRGDASRPDEECLVLDRQPLKKAMFATSSELDLEGIRSKFIEAVGTGMDLKIIKEKLFLKHIDSFKGDMRVIVVGLEGNVDQWRTVTDDILHVDNAKLVDTWENVDDLTHCNGVTKERVTDFRAKYGWSDNRYCGVATKAQNIKGASDDSEDFVNKDFNTDDSMTEAEKKKIAQLVLDNAVSNEFVDKLIADGHMTKEELDSLKSRAQKMARTSSLLKQLRESNGTKSYTVADAKRLIVELDGELSDEDVKTLSTKTSELSEEDIKKYIETIKAEKNEDDEVKATKFSDMISFGEVKQLFSQSSSGAAGASSVAFTAGFMAVMALLSAAV